jgi:hypothetical protein
MLVLDAAPWAVSVMPGTMEAGRELKMGRLPLVAFLFFEKIQIQSKFKILYRFDLNSEKI